MTTQSIEEMVEHFFTTFSHIFPEDSKWTGQVDAADAGWIRGYLESALTEAHQAGRRDAFRAGYLAGQEHKEPSEAYEEFIKALQDNK